MKNGFNVNVISYVNFHRETYQTDKNFGFKIKICKKCGFPDSAHKSPNRNCVKAYNFASQTLVYEDRNFFEYNEELSEIFWGYLRLMGWR
jgi:hypothetical protein